VPICKTEAKVLDTAQEDIFGTESKYPKTPYTPSSILHVHTAGGQRSDSDHEDAPESRRLEATFDAAMNCTDDEGVDVEEVAAASLYEELLAAGACTCDGGHDCGDVDQGPAACADQIPVVTQQDMMPDVDYPSDSDSSAAAAPVLDAPVIRDDGMIPDITYPSSCDGSEVDSTPENSTPEG
jgi:hypothetical protein